MQIRFGTVVPRVLLIVFAMVGLAVVLAACGGGGDDSTEASAEATDTTEASAVTGEDVKSVQWTMGNIPAPTLFLVGVETGGFDDLSMETTDIPGGPESLPLLKSGDIAGVAGLAEGTIAAALAAGIQLEVVWMDVTTPTELLVQSSIKSVDELDGKKLANASGSQMQLMAIEYLESQGLEFSDIELVDLGAPDASSAFKAGAVDSTYLFPPFTSELRKDGANSLTEGTSQDTISFTREFVDEHPEVVQAVVCDMAATQEEAEKDLKPAWDALAKSLELSPSEMPELLPESEIVPIGEMTGVENLAQNGEVAKRIVSGGEILQKVGQLESPPNLAEANEVVNTEFIEGVEAGKCE